jgi:hypothetical protein
MIQKNLQKLFEKEMNRKEFLAHVGAGALMVVGVSGLLKSLLEFRGSSQPQQSKLMSGYGSSAYGGSKKR